MSMLHVSGKAQSESNEECYFATYVACLSGDPEEPASKEAPYVSAPRRHLSKQKNHSVRELPGPYPKLLWRFPVKYLQYPFPENISAFCFPSGCGVDTKWRPPLFSTFIITQWDGSKSYGFSYVFWEKSGVSGEATVFFPMCLCVLSPFDLPIVWKKVIQQLYDIGTSGKDIHPMIDLLLTKKVSPVKQIKVTFLEDQISGPQASSKVFPHCSPIDLSILFQTLSVSNVVRILELLLLERSIVFVSKSHALRSAILSAFVHAIQPFEWSGILIPVLPSSALDAVFCPSPILTCLSPQILQHLGRSALEESEVVVVDIDLDRVRTGHSIPEGPTMQRTWLKKTLRHALVPHLDNYGMDMLQSRNDESASFLDSKPIRMLHSGKAAPDVGDFSALMWPEHDFGTVLHLVLATYISWLLKGHRRYYKYLQEGSDPIALFDSRSFCSDKSDASSFYKYFVSTQMFYQFFEKSVLGDTSAFDEFQNRFEKCLETGDRITAMNLEPLVDNMETIDLTHPKYQPEHNVDRVPIPRVVTCSHAENRDANYGLENVSKRIRSRSMKEKDAVRKDIGYLIAQVLLSEEMTQLQIDRLVDVLSDMKQPYGRNQMIELLTSAAGKKTSVCLSEYSFEILARLVNTTIKTIAEIISSKESQETNESDTDSDLHHLYSQVRQILELSDIYNYYDSESGLYTYLYSVIQHHDDLWCLEQTWVNVFRQMLDHPNETTNMQHEVYCKLHILVDRMLRIGVAPASVVGFANILGPVYQLPHDLQSELRKTVDRLTASMILEEENSVQQAPEGRRNTTLTQGESWLWRKNRMVSRSLAFPSGQDATQNALPLQHRNTLGIALKKEKDGPTISVSEKHAMKKPKSYTMWEKESVPENNEREEKQKSEPMKIESPQQNEGEKVERIIREGYLTKQGHVVKNWKRRWFVLHSSGALEYYISSEKTKKKGSIDLRFAKLEEYNTKRQFCFVVSSKEKDLVIAASSNMEMCRWMEDIKFVCGSL